MPKRAKQPQWRRNKTNSGVFKVIHRKKRRNDMEQGGARRKDAVYSGRRHPLPPGALECRSKITSHGVRTYG